MSADLDAVTGRVLAAVEHDDHPDPTAIRFLLRRYRNGERPDLGEPLGIALAAALERYAADTTTPARATWLRLFTEAAAISADERLGAAARHLIAALTDEWPAAIAVGEAASSIDACLAAAPFAGADVVVARAVDHLERVIGGAYRPGVGVAHSVDQTPHARGSLRDQLLAASALLTAFEITGRLPYSMLAEELMQLSHAGVDASADVDLACTAVTVWCRLAALHDDATYRGAAVIAGHADYDADAARTLDRITPHLTTTADLASYGLAAAEWRARAQADDETP